MKTILSLIILCASVFLASALDTVTVLDGGTNNVAATTTNTYNVAITPAKANNLAVMYQFKLTSSGTSATAATFQRSVDNSTWESAFSLPGTAAGTTVVTVTTNIPTGAYGYYRLNTVTNGNANAMTNVTVKYSVKNGL